MENTCNKDLANDFLRGKIIRMSDANVPADAISSQLKISKLRVLDVIQRIEGRRMMSHYE